MEAELQFFDVEFQPINQIPSTTHGFRYKILVFIGCLLVVSLLCFASMMFGMKFIYHSSQHFNQTGAASRFNQTTIIPCIKMHVNNMSQVVFNTSSTTPRDIWNPI